MNLTQADIDRLENVYQRELFPVTETFTNPVLEETRKFVVDFSTQPYNKSGSKLEALCPAIQPSLNRNAILLTLAKSPQGDIESMHTELIECGKIHKEICEIVGNDFPVAILLIYPEGDGHKMLEATNPTRFDIKTQLMKKGIMAGAFFKDSEFSSSFNPDLKPLRSPYPTFVLRNTRRFDWVFVGCVPELREIYLQQYGSPPKPIQAVHCPWTRFKNKISQLISIGKNKNTRQYLDGGRKDFWDRPQVERYGKEYQLAGEQPAEPASSDIG